MISRLVNQILYFYWVLMLLRIFLTWIPSIDWSRQPYRGMSAITDPFLNIFRGIIPPIGGTLDFSPVLALIVYQIAQGIIVSQLFRLGL